MAAVSSIIAGAAIAGSTVAGVAGANAQRSAARNAANAQVQAANDATALEREIYYDQRDLLAPSITAGADARARQMLMMGYSPAAVRQYLERTRSAVAQPANETPTRGPTAGPQGILGPAVNLLNGAGEPIDMGGTEAPAAAPTNSGEFDWVDSYDWQSSSPSYDFRFDEGQRALERSAAARGDLFSGGTGRELTRYGQEFGANEFEADFRRLGTLAGDGEQATGTTVQVAGNFGQNAANNTLRAGDARASGYTQQGQASADMYGNIAGGIGAFYGLGRNSGWWGK